jgi:hypothetical protein
LVGDDVGEDLFAGDVGDFGDVGDVGDPGVANMVIAIWQSMM